MCVNTRYSIRTRQSYETMSEHICVFKLTYYAYWIQVMLIDEMCYMTGILPIRRDR